MNKISKTICILLCILTLLNMTTFADSAVYDENNCLVYYSVPCGSTEKMCIPSVSKADALEAAKSFIINFGEEVLGEINIDDANITYSKSYPYGYNIVFPRVINGIEYTADNVSMFIDSKSGQIVSYTKNFSNDITAEEYSLLINKKSAEEQYKAAMGLNLQYNKKIVNNKVQTYLTYTADDLIINAQTGNIINVPYYIPTDGYFDIINTAEKVSEYVDDGSVISISDANNIIRNMEELDVSDDYRIVSVDYLKNLDDTYLITLTYKYGINSKEITLNAKSGLLTEYSDNSADTETDKSATVNAEAFAEKYFGKYTNEVIKRKNSTDGYDVLLYERLVNGIPYKSNGLYVYCENGKLKKVSHAWDNTEFASADSIISPEYAYEQFFNRCGLEISYYKRDSGVLTPVYQRSSKGTGIIDAETGRQLNYDGSNYYSVKEMNYIDMYSHYSGYYASRLSDCDIYVSSGSVILSDYITQQEYLLLISEFIDGTKPVLNTTGILTDDQREMLYAYMYSNGIIDRSETNYTGYITRADAVKYFLRILGHGTVGEMSEIFITHFADSDDVPENLLGYVELARSLGLVNGSADNRFYPNEFLTNGDSLIIVYNYLSKQG